MKIDFSEVVNKINYKFYIQEANKSPKLKILFLGETFRADAQTWMNGLSEFGNFEIITWELHLYGNRYKRMLRHLEFLIAPFKIRLLIKKAKPDMIIAERTTSYGFLAAISGLKPMAVAQQGITDIYPLDSPFLPLKELLQRVAFSRASLIHAWGPIMAQSMVQKNVDMKKVMVLPKGINLSLFKNVNRENRYKNKITAIVTRSLSADYKHDCIIKSFFILKNMGIDCQLLIAGQGPLKNYLMNLTKELDIENEVVFLGSINSLSLPKYLNKCNFYVSMPVTEGVSASLFEAMACGLYPMVTDLPGNKSWITPNKNGHLIPVNNSEILAQSLIDVWNNHDYLVNAVNNNLLFIREKANYNTNMKIISGAYHDLLNQSNKSI